MIYVITHKQFDDGFLDDSHYRVLHVGPGREGNPSWLRDDTGENISEKNSSYNELTGLYWIWKNGGETPDEVTGLVHYRRFFTEEQEYRAYIHGGAVPHLLSWELISDRVRKDHVILPDVQTTVDTVEGTYRRMHYGEDLESARQAICELCPEYEESFRKVMHSHHASYGNMMVCRKEILDQYAGWLFPVLFSVEKDFKGQGGNSRGQRDEKKLNERDDEKKSLTEQNHRKNETAGEDHRSAYQKRTMGFLAERLLNVWIDHQKCEVDHFPVFNTEKRDRTAGQMAAYRIRTFFSVLRGESQRK